LIQEIFVDYLGGFIKNKTLKYVTANRDNRVLQCKSTIYLLYLQIFSLKNQKYKMKYEEYEKALSVPRIGKYKIACNGDKNKALILYRYNINFVKNFTEF